MNVRCALLAILAVVPLPAAAQTALRDGVVMEMDRGVVYALTPKGLEAISTGSGATLWSLQGERKPLAVINDMLITHESRSGSTLALRILDRTSGALLRDISARLPAEVTATVVDTPGKSFRVTATLSGSAVVVSWSFATRTDLNGPQPFSRAPEQGTFRVDPVTGGVTATRVEAPRDPAFPGLLGQAFRSGSLNGSTPSLSGGVYSTAQRSPLPDRDQLVLRRWNATSGAPLADILLSEGGLSVPYPSFDGRYIIAGRATERANETTWTLHDSSTGTRVAEMIGRGAPGAFAIAERSLLHVASAFGHRVGSDWVQEPLKLRTISVDSGAVLWTRELLDTEYRGPMPPRTLQPSQGLPRPGSPKRPPQSPSLAAPSKAQPPTPAKGPAPAAVPATPAPTPEADLAGSPSFLGVTWTPQGPGPITKGQVEGIPTADNAVVGAVHAVAPHPTNPDILYVGGANGGIWKTINAKASPPAWTRLTDTLESASIGALEYDPTDATHNTLIAAIAKVSAFAGRGGPRRGLKRTTDGGANWTLLPSLAGKNITGVAARGATIVVSVNIADNFACPEIGVFRSTDTGATFTQVSGGGFGGGVANDLASDPTNPAVLYTSLRGTTNCGTTDGVYRSADTGATWTKVSSAAMDTLLGGSSNVEFSVNRSGHVYLGTVTTRPERLSALFRSADNGASWTPLDLPTTTDGGVAYGINPGGQGATHFSISADRTNVNVVYVGGDRQPGGGSEGGFPNTLGAENYTGRLFRIDASKAVGAQVSSLTHCGPTPAAGCGGVQSTNNNSAPHGDSRDMATDADGHIIQVDDGGVYRRTTPTGLGDWFSLNGNLAVNECHDVGYDTVSDIAVCGTQDVGSAEQSAKASAVWNTINQGDGGDIAIDPATAAGRSTRYSSAQNLGGFRRRTFDAGAVMQSDDNPALAVQGGAPALVPLFVTPVVQNAITPARLVFSGSNFFYESLDRGDTLTRLTEASNEGRVNAIAYGGKTAGNDNAEILYAGGGPDGDKVYVRTTAGNALAETATVFPGGTVIDLTIDPTDGAKVYVLSLATGAQKIYASSNSGGTWRDITGNLPTGTEFATLEFVSGTPAALLVGGYGGVLQMDPTTEGVWAKLGIGLSKVLVFDLHYDPTDRVVTAGTLGRGAWTLALGGATQASAPTVGSPTSTAITATGATLGGDVTSDGGSAVTERGVVFSVTATNGNPLIGGTAVSKVTATGTTGIFTATATGLSAATGYTFKPYATNALGTAYGTATTLTTLAGTTIPRLVNISTRGLVATGDNILIGGFIVGAGSPKKVIIRGRGPSLTALGVPGALANPALRLFSGATPVDFNDNWQTASNAAEITNSGQAPSDPAEAAILTTVNPGVPYTVHLTGVGETSGIAIVEVFELDKPEVPLLNISTRGVVLTGDNVMIGGFIIQGDGPQRVLINAKGPTLGQAPFNLTGSLPDPTIELFQAGNPNPIATNDNWGESADAAAIQATGNGPSGALESSIIRTLNPGAYTAIVKGKGAFQGIGLVEVFIVK